jgi:hypothetical protein
MGFAKKNDHTALEHELHAQRPQPPSELVRTLSSQIVPMQHTRRFALPKIALVAAVTAALVASLGVAGALGSAGSSVHSFGISVVHLVSRPTAPVVVTPVNTLPGHTTTSSGAAAHYPFQSQYGHLISICWHGTIIQIPANELFFYLHHGARPPGLCLHWRPYNP